MKTAGRLSRRSQMACQPIRAIRAGQTGAAFLRPRTGLFYFSAWEDYATIYRSKSRNIPRAGPFGRWFSVLAPAPDAPTIGIGRTNPVNNWTDEVGHASLKAMDPNTGKEVWEFEQYDVSDSGMLTTVTDLLITGGRKGTSTCSTQKWRITISQESGWADRHGTGISGGWRAIRLYHFG